MKDIRRFMSDSTIKVFDEYLKTDWRPGNAEEAIIAMMVTDFLQREDKARWYAQKQG